MGPNIFCWFRPLASDIDDQLWNTYLVKEQQNFESFTLSITRTILTDGCSAGSVFIPVERSACVIHREF